jgi:molybdopterin molybdotransferase
MSDPPPLRDDCFALPPGVHWVPVEDALARLRAGLAPVAGVETVPLAAAEGRVLAADLHAARANPPCANSAIDGYGFAAASLAPDARALPLHPGRAAAGVPFAGTVPPGQALRILTGAMLPAGVDTVVLEEDCVTDGATVRFARAPKPRANTRPAGEDVRAGRAGAARRASPAPAGPRARRRAGLGAVAVRRPLRVGVLSTGDEIGPPARRSSRTRSTTRTAPCCSRCSSAGAWSRSISAMQATARARWRRRSTGGRPRRRRS